MFSNPAVFFIELKNFGNEGKVATIWVTELGNLLLVKDKHVITLFSEYEILIVERGDGSTLQNKYVGMFVPRDTACCSEFLKLKSISTNLL